MKYEEGHRFHDITYIPSLMKKVDRENIQIHRLTESMVIA
jgi:hypothetical protein